MEPAADVDSGPAAVPDTRFRLLYLGSFISYADRFAIAPLLVSISRDLGKSLGAVTVVASAYFLFYGLSQFVYGVLSDRVGRVRVMRWALVGMGVGNLAAGAAPGLETLVVAKAVAGGFAGAVLPMSLVYVGDRVAFAGRQHVIANVLAAGAVGTVIASAGAGLLGRFATWRLVFVIVAVFALGLGAVVGRLPESLGEHRGAGPLTQLRAVARHPWALFLVGLAVVEGAVILGCLTFLAPALQASGQSAAVAGTVVAAYGVAIVTGMQLLKRLMRRTSISSPWLITIGGVLLVAAYLTAAASQGVVHILVASVLVGLAYTFLHSTLQTWATEAAPEARATATSLFVTGVSVGAAVATAALGGLADDHRYGVLFVIAAAVTVPVAVVAALARGRFASPAPPAGS